MAARSTPEQLLQEKAQRVEQRTTTFTSRLTAHLNKVRSPAQQRATGSSKRGPVDRTGVRDETCSISTRGGTRLVLELTSAAEQVLAAAPPPPTTALSPGPIRGPQSPNRYGPCYQEVRFRRFECSHHT